MMECDGFQIFLGNLAWGLGGAFVMYLCLLGGIVLGFFDMPTKKK